MSQGLTAAAKGAMVILVAVALISSVTRPVAGDARDRYKEGQEAREAGDLAAAAAHFSAAIAERRDEKSGWRSYFPYYYLGVVRAEQGACPEALLAFGESERQAAIRSAAEEYADLQVRRAECQRLLDQVETLTAGARADVARAEEAEATLSSISRLPQLSPRWEEEFADDQRWATERLSAARASLQRGIAGQDPATLESARSEARTATEAFERVSTAARDRLRSLDRAAADALGQLEEVEGSLRRILRSISDLEPYRGELAIRVGEAEALLAQSTGIAADLRPSDLQQLKDRLTVAMSRLRRSAQRPPKELTAAAEAFLGGDYEGVLTSLADVEGEEVRAKAQMCLLRGASEHALFVLGGESEPDRLAAATVAIRDCGALAPVPSPSERYFSPRFLELYRSILAADELPAAD